MNSLASFCHQYHVYSSVILFLDLLHSWVLHAISFADTYAFVYVSLCTVSTSGSISVDLASLLKVALIEHLLRPNWILISSLNYHSTVIIIIIIIITIVLIILIILSYAVFAISMLILRGWNFHPTNTVMFLPFYYK